MTEPREKKNTAARQSRLIQDADYVPCDQAPDVPWVRTTTRERSPLRKAAPVCVVLTVAVLAVGWANGDFRQGGVETVPPARSDTRQAVSSPLPGLTGVIPAPGEEHPRLGISARTVTAAVAEYYAMKDDVLLVPGVQIFALDDKGPAARAGALPGDIITALEDRGIVSEEELDEAEDTLIPGDTVHLTVYRDGEYVELEAVLTEESEP